MSFPDAWLNAERGARRRERNSKLTGKVLDVTPLHPQAIYVESSSCS